MRHGPGMTGAERVSGPERRSEAALRFSRHRLCYRSDRPVDSVLGIARFTDVDAALEECAVFDGDARGGYVAGERAFAADVYAVAGMHVAAHLAQHDYLARRDVGRDLAVAADGDAVARKVDRAFHLAVYIERL